MRLLLVMVLVACDTGAAPPPAPQPPVDEPAPPPQVAAAPAPPPEVPHGQHGTMRTKWSKIEKVDSCWYFSGPDGRDTQLRGDVTIERDDNSIRMTWGNATFTGTFENGELSLSRTTSHDFDGEWVVTEHIKGKYVERAIHGTYRYNECEHGTPCPNHCTINAELDLTR